eukprot:TRINITY_DN31669_c0_g1_i1.p1 TRINITY_DN31669_c0_g1~~TRINITY_DN31669_c0_g1_i1.p1  ORF type:complete len:338 (-),score=35.86 TRINITY_DN31669_c0_g1_i1:307-1320(-)
MEVSFLSNFNCRHYCLLHRTPRPLMHSEQRFSRSPTTSFVRRTVNRRNRPITVQATEKTVMEPCSMQNGSNEMMKKFVHVANAAADAAGEVIRQYFRKPFDILHKDDQSPVTIADRLAEEAMRSIIFDHFPAHAIFGEEKGWTSMEKGTEFVWVLDPIDGTKSFITGKPLFGTLIALMYKDTPVVGIIDQPILHERWIGKSGERSTYNGHEICTRSCDSLSKAYMYTTSPHLFRKEAEEAFIRVRDKVKFPLYGCDCYAFALLSSGYVDLVIESGLKLYDFMALIPIVEGAGGIITDWKGQHLRWNPINQGHLSNYNVIAAGDALVHREALSSLQWN